VQSSSALVWLRMRLWLVIGGLFVAALLVVIVPRSAATKRIRRGRDTRKPSQPRSR